LSERSAGTKFAAMPESLELGRRTAEFAPVMGAVTGQAERNHARRSRSRHVRAHILIQDEGR
jgi:hypothetical protein